MLGTRGTAFWEYYDPSMFNDEKWDINAEASRWISDNFYEILEKSQMFSWTT